jgi:hypothetical protein
MLAGCEWLGLSRQTAAATHPQKQEKTAYFVSGKNLNYL